MELLDDLPMLDLPLCHSGAAFISSGELDQLFDVQAFTAEQAFVPQQAFVAFAPQQAWGPEQVFAIQKKLLDLKEDELLANADLEIIANNIDCFSNDELHRIPNVWCKGQGAAATKAACEQMIMLKIVSCQVGIPLGTVIKPFLTHKWCACKCSNSTGSRKDQKCARERCPGSLTCSRHSKVSMSVSQYLAL